MNSYLIAQLRAGRKAAGLTQKQAAQRVGVKQTTLSGYETGASEPEIDKLIELFKLYKQDYKSILETAYQIDSNSPNPISPDSETLIRKIDQLPDWERKIIEELVNGFLDADVCRQTDTESLPSGSYIHRSYFKSCPSAGSGNEMTDEHSTLRVKDTPEAQTADYVLRVDGCSMEPMFYDGDLVLVKKQDAVDDGEIGIFAVDGESFIKQKKPDSLHSINADYPDVPLNEFSTVYTLGKVIGKAEV